MKPHGLFVSPTEFVRFSEGQTRKTLTDHIATRQRSPDFTALGMFLPNPDPILKKQGKDISVYSDLRSDALVGGSIRRRKAGVVKMEWRIERDKASSRMAKLAEATLQKLDLRRVMREMLDAPLFGWQPMELVWSAGGGPVVPLDIVAKPAGWFLYDSDSQLRFRSREAPMLGELLQPRKFLVPAQDASYANPYGFADLSMCFWPTVFKRGGLKFWVTFTEKYGTPWLVGKVPRGTPSTEQDKLLDQLEAMVQDAVAVIPDDASVDTVEAGAVNANADLYERLLMFCRSEISIALLGQNQTTESNSNRASATAGLMVTDDLRDADARLLEAAVNQVLRWMVDLNEGEAAPAPRFELYEQEEVDKLQAERDEILVKAGVKFTSAYFKKTYNLDDEDLAPEVVPPTVEVGVLASPPLPAPAVQPAAPEFAEAPAPAPVPDALDDLVDASLEDWEPLVSPMLAPLQAALDQAIAQNETAAELLARLPAVLDLMESNALQEALATTAFLARLGGVANLPLEPGEAGDTDQPAAVPAFSEAQASPPQMVVHVHPNIYLPQQAVPVVNNTIQLPEQAAPQVHVQVEPTPVTVANQVHPAGVTVIDNHPTRAEQVVERDANDEITKTITTYIKDSAAP